MLWTAEHFGARQAEIYHERINSALQALAREPFPIASKARDQDMGSGYRTLHLGGRSRHLVLYRVETQRVFVLRILHDSMDLAQHLPDEA